MKKVFPLVIVALFGFTGCNNGPESKAKDLIKKYIKENANDPNSYEAVEFDNLDTLKTFYASSPEFLENENDYENGFINEERYRMVKDSIRYGFKPEFSGFMMRHKFRANNALGGKVLNTNVFYFNDEMTSIDSVATAF